MHYKSWLATEEIVTSKNIWDYLKDYYCDGSENLVYFNDVTETELKQYNKNKEMSIRYKEDGTWEYVSRYTDGDKRNYEMVPVKDLCKTFKDYIEDWCEYKWIDGRAGYYTNPQSLFDWFAFIGEGRWKDDLLLFNHKRTFQAQKKDINIKKMHHDVYQIKRRAWNLSKLKRRTEAQEQELFSTGYAVINIQHFTKEEFLKLKGQNWPYILFYADTAFSKENISPYYQISMSKIFDEDFTKEERMELEKQEQNAWNEFMEKIYSDIPDHYWITVVDLHD